MSTIPTLAETVGRNLKARRITEGLSQEDVAGAVQRLGLPWTRPVVNQVERGSRRLNLDEAVILCEALGLRLDDLLAGDGEIAVIRPKGEPTDGRILLESVDTTAALGDVRRTLATRRPTGRFRSPRAGFAFALEVLRKSPKRPIESRLPDWRRWWPDLDTDPDADYGVFDDLGEAAGGVAEQVAARKLSNVLRRDLDALDVAAAALGRWGESLTVRRNRLTGDDGGQQSALRGHVTRGLVKELAEHMKETNRGER